MLTPLTTHQDESKDEDSDAARQIQIAPKGQAKYLLLIEITLRKETIKVMMDIKTSHNFTSIKEGKLGIKVIGRGDSI